MTDAAHNQHSDTAARAIATAPSPTRSSPPVQKCCAEMMSMSVARIQKNRCRTTIAERMVETRAELPFIGDQVGLFRALPGRPKRTCNSTWRPKCIRTRRPRKFRVARPVKANACYSPPEAGAVWQISRGCVAGTGTQAHRAAAVGHAARDWAPVTAVSLLREGTRSVSNRPNSRRIEPACLSHRSGLRRRVRR
jgi:hypothetical protein